VQALEDRCLPSTFTVTNTGDNGGVNPAPFAGTGTLRQAIVDADASSGSNTIAFNIPGSGVQTITPLSPLPALTAAGTTVNGYTQPGARANTLAASDNAVLLIELDGSAAGAGVDGLDIQAATCTVRGLVINRFSGNGISLSGASGDVVAGNFLGTDPTGTVAEGNGVVGVALANGATHGTIGGATAAARNVISGNVGSGGAGVELLGATTSGNTVAGNFIGTDATGTASLTNWAGIIVQDATGNTIGGTVAGDRNVISGNSNLGGSGAPGVSFSGAASKNLVEGNYIGVNAAGSAALANAYGVYFAGTGHGNTVGGTTAAARNVISGNLSYGAVFIGEGSNTLEGNYLGTDPTGSAAVSNGDAQIVIEAGSNNLIGGTAAGAGNVISGGASRNPDGIWIIGTLASKNTVQHNLIGTTAAGTAALGNLVGVALDTGSTNNLIGGTTAAARNVISGNAGDGVEIVGSGTTGNTVEGNFIGLNKAGTAALPNGGDGVTINASGNHIGGTATGAGNRIADNTGAGVNVAGGTGDSILGNSIYGNAGGGIVLAPGANNNQPAPQITFAKAETTATVIEGVLFAAPSTTYTLEFFADPSGSGQGQTFLKRVTVTTDAFGLATFIVNLPLVPAGQVITATATDPGGDTSVFASPFVVS
jgi:titin